MAASTVRCYETGTSHDDVRLCAETGGNVKELQTMARHSTPDMTMNQYARARNDWLSELQKRLLKPYCHSQIFGFMSYLLYVISLRRLEVISKPFGVR